MDAAAVEKTPLTLLTLREAQSVEDGDTRNLALLVGGSPNLYHLSGLHGLHRTADLRCELKQIVELRASDGKDDDSQAQSRDVLLELKVAIRGEENVERPFGAPEKLTVLYPRPPRLHHRLDLEAGQRTAQRTRHVLIQQHPPHATFASSAWAACSRKATACSRRTLGK
jgi:hypothetical protein